MSDVFLPFAAERVAIVSLTRHGVRRAATIQAALPGSRLFAPEKFGGEVVAECVAAKVAPKVTNWDGAGENVTLFAGKLGDLMPTLFADFDGIVAVVSLGAMVRLVAPHLKDKASDPGIVVVDETGKFAIPMLAGHLGGANALAARIAAALGATPVYTTASDARQTLAVDLLGREFGWHIEATKEVLLRASAAVVNDAAVALVQEAGQTGWWASHANGRSGPLPDNLRCFARLEEVDPEVFDAVLWVSERALPSPLAEAFAGRLVTFRPGKRDGQAA
jgi:cobalt-precorrin 5A hydrolase